MRQLLNVSNLLTFQRFISMCAARSGQLLNLNSLAADCGISQPTARQWLTVLQASHLVALLPPYHRNFGKRLVKTPKLYFLDSGLLCHLLRITAPDDLLHHAQRGAVFETWVVAETLKHRFNRALAADVYFWRDNIGTEVDVVLERGNEIAAIEIKSGPTVASDAFGSLGKWRKYARERGHFALECRHFALRFGERGLGGGKGALGGAQLAAGRLEVGGAIGSRSEPLLEAGRDEGIEVAVEHFLRVGDFDVGAQILDARVV